MTEWIRKLACIIGASGCLLIGGKTALAADTTAKHASPVTIQSDQLDVWHAKHEALFVGHVHLTRGDFELFCDRMQVRYADKGGIQRAVATGHVRMRQGNKSGRADRAELDNQAHTLTLTGHAVMEQPGGRLEGETIVHHLQDRTTEVRRGDGGRVKLRIDSDGAADQGIGLP